MNREPAVFASGLTKRFGATLAVDGISLEIPEGEIFGLVGPDGAGKSSTLRMLAGILPPDAGLLQVLGRDLMADPEAAKSDTGYMPQSVGLYGDLTVLENLRFYADLFEAPRREREERIPELLRFAGLDRFGDRLARNLSGGMQQKLGLICSLIHRPKLLLLDEPTNGVDPVSRRDFWKILAGLMRERVTLVVSTAYMDEAERCHRVGLLHQGRFLDIGTPAALKAALPGRIVEIRSDDARRARTLIEGMPRADQVTLAGDRIHIQAHDAEEVILSARRLLESNGVGILDIRTVPPSLEDLFVFQMTAASKP